jgi:hypothetical protein
MSTAETAQEAIPGRPALRTAAFMADQQASVARASLSLSAFASTPSMTLAEALSQ